jgi:hypothetical protein
VNYGKSIRMIKDGLSMDTAGMSGNAGQGIVRP